MIRELICALFREGNAMIDFPVKKIKTISVILFYINAALSVGAAYLVAVVLSGSLEVFSRRVFEPLNIVAAVLIAIAVLFFCLLVSFIISLFLFSFGQLVENSDYIRDVYEAAEEEFEGEEEPEEAEDGEPKEPKRSSGEILYNLQQSFRRATKLDDNDLMMASLKESAETLPEDEKGIINGILQNPEEEVRKIIEQFLNKNFWVEDETSQVGKGL